jgi:GT2 family glycosyltransferase
VTVLMAVYNDAEFVVEAVESVLGQSFSDFELLVVDDRGTDGSCDRVRAIGDRRIRVIANDANLGLTRSLNRGLDEATGRYVARMDADDVAWPDRLARQVVYLDAHPEVVALGGACRLIDTAGLEKGWMRPPTDDCAIRWTSLFDNPFAHPTVTLRRAVLEARGLRYDPTFRTAQDYDLWIRLLAHGRGANLAEPVLSYRLRHGITSRHREDQLRNHRRSQLRAIHGLPSGRGLTDADAGALRDVFLGVEPGPTGVGRTRLIERYLSLLADVLRTQDAGEDADRLRLREGLKAASLILRRPSPGWPHLLRRVAGLAGLPGSAPALARAALAARRRD